MSHTTTLKGIQIKDRQAIISAVNDLKAKGVDISLIENAVPRMYFRQQEEAVGNCEYVLKLKGPYDVGLKWNAAAGQYDVVLDTWDGRIRSEIGATCPIPSDAEKQGMHAIGKFTQRYAVNAARNAAAAQGYYVEGEEVDATTGEIHLILAA